MNMKGFFELAKLGYAKMRYSYILFSALVATLSTTGCVNHIPQTMGTAPPVPKTQSYQPLDFKKWGSGMYADEFFGKAVVVDGYIMKDETMGIISSDIQFAVIEKPPKRWSGGIPAMVIVSAPMSMRDIIYPIKNTERVRVFGIVQNPYSTSVFTGQVVSSMLIVRADRIETVGKGKK